ncbi:SRPBCC family protein [Arthrobacter sp. GMC3]|uniref:SRPBCC family protein n=1 Tax=Arthrobacter sp. GMC3 TaxID=2058894 RepID=UPI0011B07F4D|nr:SRPBCC family protein [Arthrobacter sp. GMC3]
MTARLYDLSSTWMFPNSQREVWDVIADPNMAWPDWWPGCTLAKPLEREPNTGTSAGELLLATTATLNFKASLGYTLSVSYHPTFVDSPREVVFDAGGDLAGNGRVVLSAADNGQTQMDIEWRVRPTNRWMTLLSPVASPAFTYAHAALMKRGETGLREYLARQPNKK